MERRSASRLAAFKPLLLGRMLAVLAVCVALSTGSFAQTAQVIPFAPSVGLSQPPNVGDAKTAAIAYHDSGAYQRDLASVASDLSAWLQQQAPQASRPALVLDIDDTALTNWEVIRADDFGRIINGQCIALPEGPCGWAAWDMLGKAPVIPSTLRVFQEARALNVAVFFITGRPEAQRAATEQNLRNAGYEGYSKVYMVPDGVHYPSAADFKAPVRAEIETAGYTIIANMGDQPSDLAGGHAKRTFLLPNPFYRIP